MSAGREKFFDGKVTQLLNFVAYSVQYASEIKPHGNIKAEALRHKKKKKNLCIACSKAFIWSSATFRVGQRELIVGG